MRLIALALLTLVSMGAAAQTKIVQIANDGKFDGGTIEVTGQEEQKEGGVKVTITVSPNSGYTIKKEAINVYATYPPSGSRADTRDIEIASNLTLLYNGSEKEDVKDASAKRDYTFIVPSGFGAWVKDAKFQNNRDGAKGTMDFNLPNGYYYLGNEAGDNGIPNYNGSNFEDNFYMCPAHSSTIDEKNYLGGDENLPLITTFKSFPDNNKNKGKSYLWAVWYIEAATGDNAGCFYIRHKETGKYLVANDNELPAATRRRVNLGPIEKPEGNDGLFKIQSDDTGTTYYIYPKEKSSGKNKYLTPSNGNKDQLDANSANSNTGGILGFYTNKTLNSAWHFVPAPCDPPVITNNFDGTFTLTAETGATIYYTTNGDTPTLETKTKGSTPVNVNQTGTMTLIKAIAKVASNESPSIVTTYELPQCAKPVIKVSGGYVTISCATAGATIHYTKDDTPATSSSTNYEASFAKGDATTIRAIATSPGYVISSEAILLPPTEVSSSDGITDMTGNYILSSNFTSTASIGTSENPFKGTIDGNMVTLSGLDHPLVAYANGATIKNVMLKDVQISGSGNVGAIAGEASGYTRIYNCGILPSSNKYESETSSVSSSDGYCGGLVGWLKDDSRVINCFSYANITGGTTVAGIVGYNDFASTTKVTDGKYTELKTAVVNCMFYGNITGGTTRYPVYGGKKIQNKAATGINNYDFYRAEANLGLADDSHYNCSWPAKEEYLTHYEYYRYLLNSNRELCGWWVKSDVAPNTLTTTEVQDIEKDASLMAKWVLDPSIAPYPILKAPGKYYSAINQDPDNRINPVSKAWESRPTSENTIMTKAAPDTEGQKLGSITVNINKGGGRSGSDSKNIPITAMDIENNDFCYGKIQLPYYNSIFGDPNSNDWATRYGGNYGDQVVVGWEISAIEGGVSGITDNEDKGHKFTEDWQDGYNFADRYCTTKDENRTFAQGGYYYVPNGVSAITITAKWADAVYLDNSADHSYDRVYMSYNTDPNKNIGYHFAPAGSRPSSLGNGKTVQTASVSNQIPNGSVYEKAIVLVGNHQYRTGGANLGSATKGCTIISADFDLDDEPDYCLVWQLGTGTTRQDICPIRFDFLPVIEMGMAMKEDASTQYYSLGCYLPSLSSEMQIAPKMLLSFLTVAFMINIVKEQKRIPMLKTILTMSF